VTLDNADRLAVMAIANEIDRLAGGSTIEKVLFTPFRAGTAHIMIFRPVSPGWAVPGWTQKGQHGADGTAQEGNDNGCGERISRHVMPQS
jgi:hypothetical protein